MAAKNLYNTSALDALNEKDYINKLYDTNTDQAKDLLKQNYTDNTGVLDTEKQTVQQQTQENVNRTQVEAQKAQDKYTGPKLSAGAQQQSALSRGNAVQSNVTSLQQKQSDADAEIERQRQLLASQYSNAIKQAQADNDMERAQQLYNAAKEEEATLLDLKYTANSLLSAEGDDSIGKSLLKGNTPTANYSGKTWDSVLKNEDTLNKVYDNQYESEKLELENEYNEALSDLQAKRAQQQAETDANLTESYVDALQKMKNYSEVQTAYGQGSGTAAAARTAQDTELQKTLTDLRGVQADADANYGIDIFDTGKTYRENLYDTQKDINQKRAEALLEAAEGEEEKLYNTQLKIGQDLADNNTDYSVLGKLYGLTKDQIDRLQGTGAYATTYSYGEDDSGSGSSPTLLEQFNYKYHSGATPDELTRYIEAHSDGGKIAGGNLTDYLSLYL
jgi:hypothetical protein